MTKRRRLRPEDEALWNKVTAQVEPLHPSKPSLLDPTPDPPAPSKAEIKPFTLGSRAPSTSTTALVAAEPSPAMDSKLLRRMSRGKLVLEAKLDLHGDTQAEAHGRLIEFIQTSALRGLRLVLVITGKGRPADHLPYPSEPRGVLRRQVPLWLRSAPLSSFVLEVKEAHIRHGGGGALYVYLRRRKGQRT